MTRLKEDLGDQTLKVKLVKKLNSEKKKEKHDNNYKPLIYKGHHINTLEELRDLVSIESFEEVVQGIVRKTRIRENVQAVPEADRDITNRVDPTFFKLV
jgi:hypothetical protein